MLVTHNFWLLGIRVEGQYRPFRTIYVHFLWLNWSALCQCPLSSRRTVFGKNLGSGLGISLICLGVFATIRCPLTRVMLSCLIQLICRGAPGDRLDLYLHCLEFAASARVHVMHDGWMFCTPVAPPSTYSTFLIFYHLCVTSQWAESPSGTFVWLVNMQAPGGSFFRMMASIECNKVRNSYKGSHLISRPATSTLHRLHQTSHFETKTPSIFGPKAKPHRKTSVNSLSTR